MVLIFPSIFWFLVYQNFHFLDFLCFSFRQFLSAFSYFIFLPFFFSFLFFSFLFPFLFSFLFSLCSCWDQDHPGAFAVCPEVGGFLWHQSGAEFPGLHGWSSSAGAASPKSPGCYARPGLSAPQSSVRQWLRLQVTLWKIKHLKKLKIGLEVLMLEFFYT